MNARLSNGNVHQKYSDLVLSMEQILILYPKPAPPPLRKYYCHNCLTERACTKHFEND